MFRNRFASRTFCVIVFLAIPALAAAQNILFNTILPNATGTAPTQVATGDFNGNGIADAAVTSSRADTVSILLGTGDGNFKPAVNYSVGADPVAIVAGDFNHDGHLDLAVLNSNPNTGGAGGSISILSGLLLPADFAWGRFGVPARSPQRWQLPQKQMPRTQWCT